MRNTMTHHEATSCVPALHELIAREVDWVGVHECLTDAYKDQAHKILTEAGYTKGDQLFMGNHIDPNMAHYRYYHPRVVAAANKEDE